MRNGRALLISLDGIVPSEESAATTDIMVDRIRGKGAAIHQSFAPV